MISIGNDIVDFSVINVQRSADIRFYSKFVTNDEQDMYTRFSGNLAKVNLIWLLWSIKESCFKFYHRHHPETIFSPSKIVISNLTAHNSRVPLKYNMSEVASPDDNQTLYKGEVTINNMLLQFTSLLQTNFVATVVDAAFDTNNVFWGIADVGLVSQAEQSQSVREYTLNQLKSIYPKVSLCILKSETGYPVLLIDGSESNVLLSFAHHGRFVSYCIKQG